jgi:hypothetical protein
LASLLLWGAVVEVGSSIAVATVPSRVHGEQTALLNEPRCRLAHTRARSSLGVGLGCCGK